MKIFKWILKYLEKLVLERHVSDYIKKELSVQRGSQITGAPADPLFTLLVLAKLHHGNCLAFALIYLDSDNRGLTNSQGYNVTGDLGIDF